MMAPSSVYTWLQSSRRMVRLCIHLLHPHSPSSSASSLNDLIIRLAATGVNPLLQPAILSHPLLGADETCCYRVMNLMLMISIFLTRHHPNHTHGAGHHHPTNNRCASPFPTPSPMASANSPSGDANADLEPDAPLTSSS